MFRIVITLLIILLSCKASAQQGLPQLKLSSKKMDFGRTLYMETRSQTLTFKNIGDTVLTIYYIDSLKPPFFTKFFYPDTLKKNDSITYSIIYNPMKAGRDSQRVFLRADTRLSHSIALLFDISYGMGDPMPRDRNISKIDAAVQAGRQFIKSMINTSSVQDEAAIFTFWGRYLNNRTFFKVNQDFTSNKNKLISALPNSTKPATALYDALAETIKHLQKRKLKKVLVALTDGEDNSSRNYDPSDVIKMAKQNKIIIYTIGIGSKISVTTLTHIAEQTGGKFFNAMTRNELNDIYFRIFSELSKNVTIYFDVLGTVPQPVLTLDCPDCPVDCSDGIIRHLPGDTVDYKVFLNEVNNDGAQGKHYEMVLKFNISMLYPIDDNFKYNGDGTVSFFGTIDSNLYTSPIKTLRFMTLVGNDSCTDIRLEKIIWNDKYFGQITSNDLCKICISSCARNISQIDLLKNNRLEQNFPNPFSSSSVINFKIENAGYYKLEIFDLYGNTVLTPLARYLQKGNYSIIIKASDLPQGTYFYSLNSNGMRQIKKMIVTE